MLRSNLGDCSDAYIVAEGEIAVKRDNNVNRRNKKLIFKNNAPFRSCISKINNTFIGNVENLDIFMPMYNLLEYSDNYSITSGSLWIYYKDEVNNDAGNYRINNNKIITSKSFEYKRKIIGKMSNNNSKLETEVVVLLKYLSNCWSSIFLSLNVK